MALVAAFHILWKAFENDVELDRALESMNETLSAPRSAEDIKELLNLDVLEKKAETGAPGTALVALMLRSLVATSNGRDVVSQAIADLRDPAVLDEIEIDVKEAPKLLADLAASLQLVPGEPRRQILAIRNGFDPCSDAATKLREVCDLRVPVSPYILRTGDESAGGPGEQEMVELLRRHLEVHAVDLIVTYSRGCRLLVEHIIGGATPCWQGPVLALSPAGGWGPRLAASHHTGGVLIAASGDDLVELGGAHPVMQWPDVEAMREAERANPTRRELVFEEDRRGGWADSIQQLSQRAVAM